MSKRIVCDGCDGDISDAQVGARYDVTAEIDFFGCTEPGLIGPFDLCGSCASGFTVNVDPRNWIRAA